MFGCDLSKFIKSVDHVLPYKGESMSRFYVCKGRETQIVKLCFYRKTLAELYEGVTNVVSQTDAEISILEILRDTVLNAGLTPCILSLAYSEICNGVSGIAGLHPECDYNTKSAAYDDVMSTMCRYVGLVTKGLAHDKCAFLVTEKCDITLRSYMTRTVNNVLTRTVFKSLLFQIIHAYWVISKIYPGFRHYDLHSENIMLKFEYDFVFKMDDPKYLQFVVDDTSYYVPYFGITPKIIDFQFSVLPEKEIISNITRDLIQMYHRSDNDLLFLFHHIYHMNTDFGVHKILQRLDPTRSYINYYTEHIRNIADKIPTYEAMVTNSIWREYKKSVSEDKILEKYGM